jgi:GMP synthase (glutamine-hydrolysing)
MSNVSLLYCGSSFTKSLYDKLTNLDIRPFLMPSDTPLADVMAINPIAIMITGSPMAPNHPKAPRVDTEIYYANVPVLGICYGMQRMAIDLGGKVKRMPRPERECVMMDLEEPSTLFRDFDEGQAPVWMMHTCKVTEMPEGFSRTGSTEDCSIASMEDERRGLYSVQCHPEHLGRDPSSQAGTAIIWNFLNGVCGHEI